MTVEQSDVVDFIGTERSSGVVVLTIADHLEWNSPHDHLLTLQEKINCYLAFVESGEINDSYPQARGRSARIHVAFKHPLIDVATEFLETACTICQSAGIGLTWKVGT